ncbi:MAG: thioredoxin domain-containing protein [Pirellulales bacterium]
MVALSTVALWASIAAAADPMLVEFSAPGCQHCRMMDATIRRVQSAGYTVQRVDAVQHREIATQYGVTGTPTYFLVVDGQSAGKIEGATSYDRLVQWLESGRARPAGNAPEPMGSPTPPSASSVPTTERSPDTTPPSRPASPAPAPSPVAAPIAERARPTTAENPEQLALQATVRIRIADDTGTSVATGTIVEVHNGEALILTCGHAFRASRGKGEILVDLFVPGAGEPIRGELVDFDFYRDIGLVSIRPNLPVKPVPVAAAQPGIEPQSAVFSVGCDNGGQPRLERSKVTRLNRYTGPENVEVSGAPTNGRSGGGLFNAEGALVGVCNASNEPENEGIYAALSTIHWQLGQVGLARLIPGPAAPSAPLAPSAPPAPIAANPEFAANPSVAPTPPVGNSMPPAALTNDHELVVIVRSKNSPQAPLQTFIIDKPRPEMVEHLARNGRLVSPTEAQPSMIAAQPSPGASNNPVVNNGPGVAGSSTMPRSRPPLPEATTPVLRGQQPTGGPWPFRN